MEPTPPNPPIPPPLVRPPETLDVLREMLASVLRRSEDGIEPESELEADLGIDSLAMIELSVSLEERFGITMPPAASPSDLAIRTVADVASFVEARMAARGTET